MPEPGPLTLARMRAIGQIPFTAQVPAALHLQAADAGRRLVEAVIPGQLPMVMLGWWDGVEPVAGGDTGVERTKTSQVVLLTFAAVLGACWPDRSEHPFPGVAAEEDAVLAGVAALGPITASAIEGGAAGRRHSKGALRRLDDARLLSIDGSEVRLGPAIALWSEEQVAALRSVYDRLPRLEEPQ